MGNKVMIDIAVKLKVMESLINS